jgi:hypothetical protein
MIHNDVARVRDLPARRLTARALARPLVGEESQAPSAEPTPRRLARAIDARPLARDAEAGR